MKNTEPYRPLPEEITAFFSEYWEGGLPGDECLDCHSACCSQGGFALLDNVELIYKLYLDGRLRRDDFVFTPGQSFGQFIFQYFDVRSYSVGGREMAFFHMRNLDSAGNLIAIPEDGGSYWETRYHLFREDPSLNRGCVFLSSMVTPEGDDNTGRGCILHVPESLTHLTAKPIDCLLFVCVERPGVYKKPRPEETEKWFTLLSQYYAGSIERLKSMLVEGFKR